jgi:hypothetical protein
VPSPDYDGVVDGVIVLPGGWSVPADKMPGWPFDRYYPNSADPIPGFHPKYGLPLTAPRGGIKYPSPKGNTMPSLNNQLTALKNKQENLAAEIANLERKIKASRPAPPPLTQSAWTIDVRFNPNGGLYNYLILRHNGIYYTTGTGSDGKFLNWASVLEWLDGMASHSALLPLQVNYEQAAPLEGKRGY